MTYFASTSMDMSGTPDVADLVPLTDAELEAVGAGFLSVGLPFMTTMAANLPGMINTVINGILKIFNG